MKRTYIHIFSASISGFLLVVSGILPGVVHADAIDNHVPSVIITELLTGTKTSGSQEFIELYNTTDQPIDLTGWQLWYLSAQATDQNKPSSNGVIMLGDNALSSVIAAHGYYLLSGRSDYLTTMAQQFYNGTMAATGGNLRLLRPDDSNPCSLSVQDQVGWGNALYAWGAPALAPSSGQSIARPVHTDGMFQNTYHNDADFNVTANSTPGNTNTLPSQQPDTNTMPVVTVQITGCSMPPAAGGVLQPGNSDSPPIATPPDASAGNTNTDSPSVGVNTGLVTPQITELLPNPGAPQDDAHDEFIELYNSNEVPFDLSGFMVEVGLTTTHRYVFPSGTILQPLSFTSFYSKDTGLSLSNSGGQVLLLDPSGNVLNRTEAYATAKEGQVWALANGMWYWSIVSTPNAPNSIVAAANASKKTANMAAAATKKSVVSKAATTPKAKSTKAKTAPKTKATTPKATATTHDTKSFSPLHPSVLAVVALFALLYGLYEYRQDVANKFYQLRENRAARRAARSEPERG